jgi:hypothetical protein
MTTPETPDLIPSQIQDPLPSEPNPLFDNLVPTTPQTRALDDKLTFAQAMPEMGMASVFDIIREPKQAFAARLRTLSDADGDMAYDNALCYATQIARSYREELVSSGRDVTAIGERSGVRALVDIGPSYPNLFKENWDQFCKVGAIEAMDGPVAYLSSLRRFAAEKIEGASTSPLRIPLAVRRPDLDTLVIDEQSTYQSRPMLDLVNSVLTQGIDKYQDAKGDKRPVHELLAEKKHPFVFPYHFAHQQVSLALSGDKPGLGELNRQLSQTTPFASPNHNAYTGSGAQQMLSGLSPAQQKLITQPSLFPTFTIGAAQIDGAATPAAVWESPTFSTLYPYENHNLYCVVPAQPGVTCTPAATVSTTVNTQPTVIQLALSGPAGEKTIKLDAYLSVNNKSTRYALNRTHATSGQVGGSRLYLMFDPIKNPGVDLSGDYRATFTIHVNTNVTRLTTIAQWRVCIDLAATPQLSEAQQQYVVAHLGEEQPSAMDLPLADVSRFCKQTGIDAEQLESLIARKSGRATLSPNCRSDHITHTASTVARRLPYPSHYGASYINAGNAMTPFTSEDEGYDNAVNLTQAAGSEQWRLSTSAGLKIELDQDLFERDYPGHYLRRIKRISVTLPAVLGPYEDIAAVLTQTHSTVEMDATVGANTWENMRASQQIALSSGMDDDGMFTLNFDDERYLPFEGTGAVSSWNLRFTRSTPELLASLSDVIVRVSYTAKSV